jgi:hypothetical protein
LIIATPPIKPDQGFSNLLASWSAWRKLLFCISKVPGAVCIGSRQQGHGRKWRGRPLVSAVPPDLCLGYVNTLSWSGRRAPAETLQTISGVLSWIERAAVFSPGSIDHAATWAQDNEARAARTFAMAIKLRETLFGIFTAIGAAEACDRRDFLIFRPALAHAPPRCHLVPMQRRFAWSIALTRNPVRDAMTPVLWSAADLMLGAAAI